MFAIYVTNKNQPDGATDYTPSQLWNLGFKGGRSLEEHLRAQHFEERSCHVFVYQLQRKMGGTFDLCDRTSDCVLQLAGAPTHQRLARIVFLRLDP